MKKNRKIRVLSYLLILCIVIAEMPCITFAQATLPKMRKGVLEWTTQGKKASGAIKYRTVGWMVHTEEVPSGEVARSGKRYGKIDMQQVGEQDVENGEVKTTFQSKKQVVKNALKLAKNESGKSEPIPYENGQTVYLSAIMVVMKGDNVISKPFYNLSDIKKAQPWAKPGDLDQYYNLPVELDLDPEPVQKVVKINGEVVDKHCETYDKQEVGSFKTVAFKGKIEHKGKTATLKETYCFYGGDESRKYRTSVEKGTDIAKKVPVMIDGTKVVGEYWQDVTMRVEQYNLDADKVIEVTKDETLPYNPKTPFEGKRGQFEGLGFIDSVISYDNGTTWTQRDNKLDTRTVTTSQDTVIRFNFGKNTDIRADLEITANPSSIEEGNTENVEFTLNAKESKSKNPIVKYEFWFGDKKDLEGAEEFETTEAVQKTSRDDVKPLSWWYGKVKITDNKGNTATATAKVKIDEMQKKAVAFAKIKDVELIATSKKLDNYAKARNLVDYIDHIERDKKGYTAYIKADKEIIPTLDTSSNSIDGVTLYYDMNIDATPSWCTNGVEKYVYNYRNIEGETYEVKENTATPTISNSKSNTLCIGADALYFMFKDGSTEDFPVYVTVNDKVQTKVKATSPWFYVKFKTAPKELEAPVVELGINRTVFARFDTAEFVPSYYEKEGETFKIEDKSWEIWGVDNVFKDKGKGDIPSTYKLNLSEGDYKARQYIYYKDKELNDKQAFAEVSFSVVPVRPPDVSIKSDKEKYIIPTKGIFTVDYTEDMILTYPIDHEKWVFKKQDGEVITKGEGTFPTSYDFTIDMDGGYYTAEQTIYWYELGELKSKTAICSIKLISPKPTAAFDVKMQMSHPYENKTSDTPVWQMVSEQEQGKQYKHLRIDLTPSIQLNKELENPYPIDFKKSVIKIVPLTDDKANRELSRNKYIHTFKATDKTINSNIVTIKGKQYIDFRIDDYGKYRVWVQIANKDYVSKEIYKDIVIREDKAPLVDMSFEDVQFDEALDMYKTYRKDDLRVKFKVNTNVTMQDEDGPNYDKAELQIKYDYNANGDASDDGEHSKMKVRKSSNSLKPYITVNKNESMDQFDIDMFDGANPILGKIRLDYTVEKDPVIPYFRGGDLPKFIVPMASTEAMPINKKIVFVDNMPGDINVIMGKESKLDIYVYLPNSSMDELSEETVGFDLNELKAKYGENINIYIIDKNDKKILWN